MFDCPRLKKLVLVGFDFSYLSPKDIPNVSARQSTVERLSLHACRVTSSAWPYLLSLPRGLKKLSYFADGHDYNIDNDGNWRTAWRSFASLCDALAQHQDSLLDLELSFFGMSGIDDPEEAQTHFGLAGLTSLQSLTINSPEYNRELAMKIISSLPVSLRRLHMREFPYQSDGSSVLAAAQYLLAAEEEAKPYYQSLSPGPTTTERTRRYQKLPCLEELSVAFWPDFNLSRERNDRSHIFETIGQQYLEGPHAKFTVYRITEMRNAVPPYLWAEHIPSFIKVYDNTIDVNLWETKSQLEIAEAEQERLEAEHQRYESEAEARRQERRPLDQIDEEEMVNEESSVPDPVPFPGWPNNASLAQGQSPQPQNMVVPPPPTNMAVIAATMAMANANSTAQSSG